MIVRYQLCGERVVGLPELIGRRQDILQGKLEAFGIGHTRRSGWVNEKKPDTRPLADRARDAWADAVAAFWMEHPLLSQFDRQEIRFNLGTPSGAVQIVCEHPHMEMMTMEPVFDWRLHEACQVDGGLVVMIEVDEISFERKPGEPDPRGHYKEMVDWKGVGFELDGFVRLRKGQYVLAAQAFVEYAIKAETSRSAAMIVLTLLSRFCLDVTSGVYKPKDHVPAWLATPNK